jgi:LysM repeat protein
MKNLRYGFSILAMFATLALSAQDLYIRYEPQLLDRLDYTFADQTDGKKYTAYRFNKSETEKLSFETGVENATISKKVPKSLQSIRDVSLSANDVAQINAGYRRVFIVKNTTDKKYAITPVSTVMYTYFHDQMLEAVGADYHMLLDLNNSENIGNSLSLDGSNAALFYTGEQDICGKKAYTFRRTPLMTCINNADLCFLPETGLVYDQSIDYKTGDVSNTMQLANINNVPLCETFVSPAPPLADVPADVPSEYSTIVPIEQIEESEVVVEPSISREPAAPTTTCNLVANNGEHIVQGGENLYAIARRYSLTLTQLNRWNKLTSDRIYPCTRLAITAPKEEMLLASKSAVKMPPPVRIADNYKPKGKPKSADLARKGAIKTPKSYDVKVKPKGLVNQAPKKPTVFKNVPEPKPKMTIKGVEKRKSNVEPALYVKKESGLYIAKKGDNIFSIAKAHGMTEAQFRTLNRLGNGEKIIVGQVLKVEDCACNVDAPIAEQKAIATVVPRAYGYVYKKNADATMTQKGAEEPATTVKNYRKYHLVKDDETLYAIARQNGLTVAQLRAINHLDESETIITNQKIYLEE